MKRREIHGLSVQKKETVRMHHNYKRTFPLLALARLKTVCYAAQSMKV